jgi:hypothetical protein
MVPVQADRPPPIAGRNNTVADRRRGVGRSRDMQKLYGSLVAVVLMTSTGASAQIVLGNSVTVMDRVSGQPKPSTQAFRGDTVVYVLTYRNTSQQRIINYTINHGVAPTAEFIGQETGAPLMSTDGVTFAPLAQLTAANRDGSTRPAAMGDVKHLRWKIPGIIEPGTGGEVRYTARLR